MQTIAYCLGFPLETHGKTPLLKYVDDRAEIKLLSIWKLPTCWLVFIISEGTMQATRRDKSSVVLSSYERFGLQ